MKIRNGLCVALSLLAGLSVSVYAADAAPESATDEAAATEPSTKVVEQLIVWAPLPAQFRVAEDAENAATEEAGTSCADSHTLECSSVGRWSHF